MFKEKALEECDYMGFRKKEENTMSTLLRNQPKTYRAATMHYSNSNDLLQKKRNTSCVILQKITLQRRDHLPVLD